MKANKNKRETTEQKNRKNSHKRKASKGSPSVNAYGKDFYKEIIGKIGRYGGEVLIPRDYDAAKGMNGLKVWALYGSPQERMFVIKCKIDCIVSSGMLGNILDIDGLEPVIRLKVDGNQRRLPKYLNEGSNLYCGHTMFSDKKVYGCMNYVFYTRRECRNKMAKMLQKKQK